MKWMGKWLLAAVVAAGLVIPAGATETANEEAGYFENTRTVLQLDAAYGKRSGRDEASQLNRELSRIFRYPYYRKLDTSAYSGRLLSPEEMQAAAVSAGADIVVEPVVVRFDQYRRYPPFGFDADPIVTTTAEIRLYYWEEGMDTVQSLSVSYFKTDIEGPDTDADYILDQMWTKLMKKFPYRRVPTDRSRNLSGEVVSEK